MNTAYSGAAMPAGAGSQPSPSKRNRSTVDLLATVEFMSDGGNAAQVVRQVRTGGACTHPPAATGYMPAPHMHRQGAFALGVQPG
jgi:hypothetical protein